MRFEAATDDEVLEAFQTLLRREGIIAALESAHAVAGAIREAPQMGRDQNASSPVRPGRQGHLHHRRGIERPGLAAVPATESRPLNLRTYIEGRLGSRKILLMTHVIVGYPSLDVNWRMLEQMERADVDLVELQMPFSEPIADGPVFARANQEALKQGLSTSQYFDFMARATERFNSPT